LYFVERSVISNDWFVAQVLASLFASRAQASARPTSPNST